VEVGDGKAVGESTGVDVSVMVGVSVGAIEAVAGILVKAVSGNDNWPGGTQLVRIIIKMMKNN